MYEYPRFARKLGVLVILAWHVCMFGEFWRLTRVTLACGNMPRGCIEVTGPK